MGMAIKNKNKRKYINKLFDKEQEYREGDILVFDMPGFCTGDYSTPIYTDSEGDPYINKKDCYLKGCRDYYIYNKDKSKPDIEDDGRILYKIIS